MKVQFTNTLKKKKSKRLRSQLVSQFSIEVFHSGNHLSTIKEICGWSFCLFYALILPCMTSSFCSIMCVWTEAGKVLLVCLEAWELPHSHIFFFSPFSSSSTHVAPSSLGPLRTGHLPREPSPLWFHCQSVGWIPVDRDVVCARKDWVIFRILWKYKLNLSPSR